MSAPRKKEFMMGLGLMIGFLVVLVLMFMPLFEGKNGLNYMDDLYNTISKGSAYYIPKLKTDAKKFDGKPVSVTFKMDNDKQAKETGDLFAKSGVSVAVSGTQLKVDGDFGKILANCLEDSDNMFQNLGEKVRSKYGYNEKQVLFNWWTALSKVDKELKDQKKFAESKQIATTLSKGVECSYNYYTVKPEKISARWGVVLFSLIFYVVYTMWYGFAIMFMFEGAGLDIGH